MLAYTFFKCETSTQKLVLIHGYCLCSESFQLQISAFKNKVNLLLIDMPGFGESKPIPGISIDGMADEVFNVLNHLGIDNCVLAGHSMGGYITLSFAKKYPQKLKGIGLIHSTAVADTEERKAKRLQVIEFVKNYGSEQFLKTFIPGLFASKTSKQIVDDFVKISLTSSQEGIIDAAKAMMNREASINFLAETNLPVFFAIGALDELIPEKDLFKQSSTVSKSQICYLEKSAHMGFAEEPDKFNKDLLKFIDFCSHN
ncbi:MAG: alpha/beta fold hydrolase [Bacteroidia bacterium]